MRYTKKAFRDEAVELDGNAFAGCTFQRCKLIYRGGLIPHFDTCSFDTSPFMFEEGAGNTLGFLRELYHAGLHQNVEDLFDNIRQHPPGSPGER